MGADTTIVHTLPATVQWIQSEEYRDAVAGVEESVWRKIAELIVQDDFVDQFNAWVAEKAVEVQPAVDILNEMFPDGK